MVRCFSYGLAGTLPFCLLDDQLASELGSSHQHICLSSLSLSLSRSSGFVLCAHICLLFVDCRPSPPLLQEMASPFTLRAVLSTRLARVVDASCISPILPFAERLCLLLDSLLSRFRILIRFCFRSEMRKCMRLSKECVNPARRRKDNETASNECSHPAAQ
jgi:hypothetical protein